MASTLRAVVRELQIMLARALPGFGCGSRTEIAGMGDRTKTLIDRLARMTKLPAGPARERELWSLARSVDRLHESALLAAKSVGEAISTPAPQMDSFRPLFVVGHPRSGTTLLATILSRHSAIAGTPETHFFNEVQYACATHLPRGAVAIVDRLLAMPHLRSVAVERDDLLARLARYPKATMPLLFRCWLEAFAAKQGKPIVLEKTPPHIRHMQEILSWYPMARMIWILRDGRACIASLKKVDWAGNDVMALSRHWVLNVAYALQAERRCPDRIVRVRYEDLITEPELTLTRLHRVLELPFEQGELDHQRRVNTVEPWELEWKKNVFRPMMADRRFAWRQELSVPERKRATALMWDTLEQLGYEPGERLNGLERLVRKLYRTYDRIVFSDLGLWGMMAAYRQREKWRPAKRADRSTSSRARLAPRAFPGRS